MRNCIIKQESVINTESLPYVFLLLGDRLCLLHREGHFGVNKVPSPFLSYGVTDLKDQEGSIYKKKKIKLQSSFKKTAFKSEKTFQKVFL